MQIESKNMIDIREATIDDLIHIQKIAYETWPHTYKRLLSQEKMDYMLNLMYSLASLREQVEKKGHKFLLAQTDRAFTGFASYELNYDNTTDTKIHKLYTLPQTQGRGIGKSLVSKITDIAKQNHNRQLFLNVKRDNPAVSFYEKIGFVKIAEVDIPIGNGFFMEDFVMAKAL